MVIWVVDLSSICDQYIQPKLSHLHTKLCQVFENRNDAHCYDQAELLSQKKYVQRMEALGPIWSKALINLHLLPNRMLVYS